MIRRLLILLLAAAAAGMLVLRAQSPAAVDFRADVMSSLKVGDSTALLLVGHVVFHHNGAVITCDSAIRYNDRRMDCYKNVVVNKDSTFIFGDKADYDGLSNEAHIYSPLIKMIDKDATLYTYHFSFNTLTNVGHYWGGGTMSQKDNLMESSDGYYYVDTRDLVVLGDAGTHRVGLAVVRAVEVAAAGDDEAVGRAEGGALGPVLGAVAGMVHLDAVDSPFGHQLPHKGHTLVHRRVGEHNYRPGGSGCGQHLPHRRVGGGVEASAPRLPAEQLVVQPGVDAVAQAQLLQRLHDAALEEDAAVLCIFQRLLGAELGVQRLDLPAALQSALVAALAHDVAVPTQGRAVEVGPEGQQMDAVAALEVVAGELGGGDEPHAVLHRVVIGVLGAEGGVVVRKGQSAQPQPRCHQGQTVDGHRAVRAGGMGVKIASHSFYSLDLRVIFLRP